MLLLLKKISLPQKSAANTMMMTTFATLDWPTTTLLAVLALGGLIYLFYPVIFASQHSHDNDNLAVELVSNGGHPAHDNSQQPVLSVIIPAYNEQERLPVMLQASYDYLSQSKCPSLEKLSSKQQGGGDAGSKLLLVEWLVVSDGSTDDTHGAYRTFCKGQTAPNMIWKYVELPVNTGKGAAVQSGMLAATGAYRLMVDADGATDFGPGLEALIESKCEISIGSRAHLTHPSIWRRLPSQVFQMLVYMCVGSNIQDTQCGFKLFTQEAAMDIFHKLHLRGWAFDTEVIYLANQGFRVQEVPVAWTEVDGSKLHTSLLNLALVAVSMLRDMLCVRLCYTMGLWKAERRRKVD
jgi:dolichyl-phosphate beta-glucosyltransferase